VLLHKWRNMSASKPSIYLAGPIRDKNDYKWRQTFTEKYGPQFNYLIPSDVVTEDWAKLRQFRPAAYMTYRTDLDLISRCDMVVMNLLPHTQDNYPAIGTLFELGYCRAQGKLILIVADDKLRSHPFIAFGADGVYESFKELDGFLQKYLVVLNGGCPQFEPLFLNRMSNYDTAEIVAFMRGGC
jgi:nucleoside 2-deoxyribosyltransferase